MMIYHIQSCSELFRTMSRRKSCNVIGFNPGTSWMCAWRVPNSNLIQYIYDTRNSFMFGEFLKYSFGNLQNSDTSDRKTFSKVLKCTLSRLKTHCLELKSALRARKSANSCRFAVVLSWNFALIFLCARVKSEKTTLDKYVWMHLVYMQVTTEFKRAQAVSRFGALRLNVLLAVYYAHYAGYCSSVGLRNSLHMWKCAYSWNFKTAKGQYLA